MEVLVVYEGGASAERDSLIRKIARKPWDGSGCFLRGRQRRDVGFEYKSLAAARKFATQLKKRLPKWAKVTVQY